MLSSKCGLKKESVYESKLGACHFMPNTKTLFDLKRFQILGNSIGFPNKA